MPNISETSSDININMPVDIYNALQDRSRKIKIIVKISVTNRDFYFGGSKGDYVNSSGVLVGLT